MHETGRAKWLWSEKTKAHINGIIKYQIWLFDHGTLSRDLSPSSSRRWTKRSISSLHIPNWLRRRISSCFCFNNNKNKRFFQLRAGFFNLFGSFIFGGVYEISYCCSWDWMGISRDVMIFSSLVSFDICERRFSGGDVLVERSLAISRRVLALRSFENYAKSGATTRFLKASRRLSFHRKAISSRFKSAFGCSHLASIKSLTFPLIRQPDPATRRRQ